MNYARHVETGAIVFFTERAPRKLVNCHWAFYRLPRDQSRTSFLGFLIGESTDARCKRLDHRPHTCDACIGRRAA